jgi:hypothetical protein
MGITYEEALQAQAELEDELLEDPNIVSIGVVAETDSLGLNTGNYLLQVGVISMDGQSLIPLEHILSSGRDAEEKHVPIKVINEGKIERFNSFYKPTMGPTSVLIFQPLGGRCLTAQTAIPKISMPFISSFRAPTAARVKYGVLFTACFGLFAMSAKQGVFKEHLTHKFFSK